MDRDQHWDVMTYMQYKTVLLPDKTLSLAKDTVPTFFTNQNLQIRLKNHADYVSHGLLIPSSVWCTSTSLLSRVDCHSYLLTNLSKHTMAEREWTGLLPAVNLPPRRIRLRTSLQRKRLNPQCRWVPEPLPYLEVERLFHPGPWKQSLRHHRNRSSQCVDLVAGERHAGKRVIHASRFDTHSA